MNPTLATLSCAALLAVPASAQCFSATGNSIAGSMVQTSIYSVDDEGLSTEIAFNGFTFPIGGTNWTHFAVSSNGEVYLTDGTGVVGGGLFGLSSLGAARGAAGSSPRIMALSADLEGVFGLTSWDILVDDALPGQVKITWTGVRHYLGNEDFSMSMTLIGGGIVQFDYADENFGSPSTFDFAAVSAGNAVGTGAEPSQDLNAGVDSGTVELIYQNTWAPFDLAGLSVLIVPNGTGGFLADQSCGAASHTEVGQGCYDVANESVYQLYANAAIASAALQGNVIVMNPTVDGYTVDWAPGVAAALYVAPTSGATLLPVGNDGQVTFTPVVGIPSPFGTVTDLRVQGNGIVAFGDGEIDTPGSENWDPSPAAMIAGTQGGIYCWHAYNEEEGGDVWGEEQNGVVYITFENVENFPLFFLNPSTFQIQFDQGTGVITIVFLDIDTDTSSIFGTDHLIGWTPPGPSVDPGGIDLATQLPVTLFPDVDAIALSAAPAPISTGSSGTALTYTVLDAPELQPGSGIAAGVVVFSLTGDPGLDLGFLGAPGCFAYVGGLDVSVAFVGPLGAQSIPLAIPAGVPAGTSLFAQAAALSAGINAFGLVTSNAVESVIDEN